MNKKQLGGIQISEYSEKKSQSVLADHEYFYSRIVLRNQAISFDFLKSQTIFVEDVTCGELFCNEIPLFQGSVVHSECSSANMQSIDGEAVIFVAGVSRSQRSEKTLTITEKESVYRVEKPWGYELWLSGEHPSYCMKNIFIKSSFRTSLQYHSQKRETNVILSGSAELSFLDRNDIHRDRVTEHDLGSTVVGAGSVIDVPPPELHRLEAIEDLTLLEVSTGEVDDVFRISDDTNRQHGRIVSEHSR